MAADEADDSYDLAWMDDLPADVPRRLERLQLLLTTETEPLSRHYLHELLVHELYRVRGKDLGGDAAFDTAASAHDQDMASIRPALVAKFGGVPLIETYPFAAKSHAKAGDYAKARWWADRGLAVYDDQAIRPDAVEDLQTRAARYWQRLHPDPAPATSAALPGISPRDRPTADTRPRRLVPPSDSPSAAAMETLTCQTCGQHFDRPRVRGRKPHQCPSCQQHRQP